MANRISGESRVFGPLAISSCSKVEDTCTDVCTLGSDDICVRNEADTELGSAIWIYPERIH